MPSENRIQEKLEQFQQRHVIPSDLRLWINTLIYGVILFIIVSLYYFVSRGNYDLRTVNRVFGDIAIILIGLSFMLSSLCYFWNFADSFIVYRKHLGLAGFSFAVTHGLLSLFFLPKFFPFPNYYLEEKNLFPFIFALVAIVIFAGMAMISNRYAIHELGGKLWRKLLRVGYIAYVLSILHFGLKGYPYWWSWLNGRSEHIVPSFGFLMFLFGIIVILLRIKLWFATRQTTQTSGEIQQK